MSNLQADILRSSQGNNKLVEFVLLVSAGPTSRRTSVALGEAVTLSTAGITSTFTINSVDAFRNLRPGGDDMSVVFRLAGSLDIPNAGKVLDNNDGSYLVQYAITQAGRYRVSISVNGVVGVGSPFDLKVEAQLADTALTYAYGEFLDAMTGKTFSVYVQTRDRYGNFISTDPKLFPQGSDTIALEYCRETVLGGTCPTTDAQCTCQGGKLNTDVSIIVNYGVGPNGPTRNGQVGGVPYYGLYQITYFPFTSGKSTPLVRHSREYIKCYFHTGTPVTEVSVAEADACVRANIIKELSQTSTTRGLDGGMEHISSIRTHPLYWNNPAFSARPSFGWQGDSDPTRRGSEWLLDTSESAGDSEGVFRRNADASRRNNQPAPAERYDFTSEANDRFEVSDTFAPPSTERIRMLSSLIPAICFLVGTGMAVLQYGVQFYGRFKKNRYTKVHDEYIKGLEAKAKSSAVEEPEPADDGEPQEASQPPEVEDDDGAGVELPERDAAAGAAAVPLHPVIVPPAPDITPEGGPSTLNSPEGDGNEVMTMGQDLGEAQRDMPMESGIGLQAARVREAPHIGECRGSGSDSQDSVSRMIDDAARS